MLTPGRTYVFHEKKPQIDHIFPLGLDGADAQYEERVDILWNFQPIADGINNYKRARHPKEFFNSTDGAKYWSEYDFVPEPKSPIWDDPACFIRYREEQMQKMRCPTGTASNWSIPQPQRNELVRRYGG